MNDVSGEKGALGAALGTASSPSRGRLEGMSGQEQDKGHYIIRGGVEGRERLRVLARVVRPITLSLLHRAGIRPGMACLDMGCGGGDATFDLARLAGPEGRVVGVDLDPVKIDIARAEARAQKLENVEFRVGSVLDAVEESRFDLAHVRFVLSHLPNAAKALERMRQALRPGGILVVADVDFSGYFSHPESAALERYVDLYTEAGRRRGGDPHIGPRLPALLAHAGFENVHIDVVQQAGIEGEVKLLTPLTMEAIADSVVAEGLASRQEIDQVVAELYRFAGDPSTVLSGPRIVEAWATRA
jgi:ubiquinone/menaquinone biosynthesis C-methylase UbiE